jgi:DNA polymerase-3 subunit delta'
MQDEAHTEHDPTEILRRSLGHDRVHSGYLFTGGGETPREAARDFARALACRTPLDGRACERCGGCLRSAEDPDADPIVLDGKGKRGPTLRHLGDHPDLLWVERGAEDTQITIRQIRDMQAALRLGANEGGRRVAVVAEAERMNASAQNALLRVLEEPPAATTLILVASRASALLATIRSRSVRIRFPNEAPVALRGEGAGEAVEEIVRLLDGLRGCSTPALLDFAEQYRGARATAAESVTELIDVAAEWIRERVKTEVELEGRSSVRRLDAYHSLQQLRRELVQRNANPQMVAERLLLGLRDATA